MIAGGICKYGLSNLVFCSGIQNNFSYKQFLLFMKNDKIKIRDENKLENNLIFQQDNAACHTSKDSKYAIEILFGKDFIEWPPNSPDLSPIENVWAILKSKLEKRNIKNLDDLRVNILDIWSKFPVSLCEKLCNKFDEKLKYIEEFKGQRINREILEKIKKEKKGDQIINEDDEWVSVKRDNKFRIVFNDNIVKQLKSRFIKQINKQKKYKLELYDSENAKLKKGEKSNEKFFNKKDFNKIIVEKRNIIIDYYDKMQKEVNELSEKEFIIKYLNQENDENIKNLMSSNLNNKFGFDEVSTNISNKLEEILQDEEDEENQRIEEIINNAINEGKKRRVKKYIDNKIKINNFFPYEPKKMKRNNDFNKINEIESESKEIFHILNEITSLNENIKKYRKKNKEKGSEIGIEADLDEGEEKNEENEDDISIMKIE